MKTEKEKKYTHLTLEKRSVIERMLKEKHSKKEIANAIGCSVATVYNEIKRGTYMHTVGLRDEKRYAAETAHDKYRKHLKGKGRKSKLLSDTDQRDAIEEVIVSKNYSPKAALLHLQNKGITFDDPVTSVNTIYKGVEKGYFPSLKLEDLPDGGRHRRKKRKRIKQAKRGAKGTSIEFRPKIVSYREEFGHWEMDTVKGMATNRKCLLVLTERVTRKEIIEVMKAPSAKEVVRALNRLEKIYGSDFFKLFKSITVDNGSEFADFKGMEKALYRVGKRTNIFYCHPNCPHERGSNEVANRLIRRYFPKGSNFDQTVDKKNVKRTEAWMNDMPRALHGGKSANELFRENYTKLLAAG